MTTRISSICWTVTFLYSVPFLSLLLNFSWIFSSSSCSFSFKVLSSFYSSSSLPSSPISPRSSSPSSYDQDQDQDPTSYTQVTVIFPNSEITCEATDWQGRLNPSHSLDCPFFKRFCTTVHLAQVCYQTVNRFQSRITNWGGKRILSGTFRWVHKLMVFWELFFMFYSIPRHYYIPVFRFTKWW